MPIDLTITHKDKSTTNYERVIGLFWNLPDPPPGWMPHDPPAVGHTPHCRIEQYLDGHITSTLVDTRTIDTIKVEAVKLLRH